MRVRGIIINILGVIFTFGGFYALNVYGISLAPSLLTVGGLLLMFFAPSIKKVIKDE